MRNTYIEQNFLSINHEKITKYNQRNYGSLRHSQYLDEVPQQLQKQDPPQSPDRLQQIGSALARGSREVPSTVAVAEASSIERAWEVKTFTVPWSVWRLPAPRGYFSGLPYTLSVHLSWYFIRLKTLTSFCSLAIFSSAYFLTSTLSASLYSNSCRRPSFSLWKMLLS